MTPVRVRVSLGAEPAAGLPAMVGYSVVGHVVGLLLILIVPRVLPHQPPPPRILTGQIVSLPPPAGSPQAAPAAPAPASPAAPAKSAAPIAKAPEPPPPKKSVRAAPPEPDRPKPPKKETVKKEEPKKPASAGEEEGKDRPAPAKPSPEGPPGRNEPAKAPAGPIPEGVGLASGEGEPGGIPSVNSAAFPYDYYRTTIVNLIRSHWRRPVTPGLTQSLRCSVSFVIARSGALSDVTIAASSGFSTLDLSAVRAVTETSPLPQLPYQYTSESVRGEIVFELTPD